jgi:hypothetical protein
METDIIKVGAGATGLCSALTAAIIPNSKYIMGRPTLKVVQ